MANKTKAQKPILINESIKKRFFSKIKKTEECWLWAGAINPSDHGVIKIEGSNRGVHRVSYAIHYEDIPQNLMILHKCHNPSCVNPAHLRKGTAKENSQDEIERKNTRHYKCSNLLNTREFAETTQGKTGFLIFTLIKN